MDERMITVKDIFTQPGESLVVSAQVYYDTRMAFINGYRAEGGRWVKLEHGERIKLPLHVFDSVFSRYGWALSQRPVNQPGLAKHYMLVRSMQPAHSATEVDDLAASRRRFEDVSEQFEAFAQFQQEFAHGY